MPWTRKRVLPICLGFEDTSRQKVGWNQKGDRHSGRGCQSACRRISRWENVQTP